MRDSTFHEYDDSDRRATTIDAGGGVTWFSYDAMGNLTNVLDPDAFTIGFRYDEAGRVIAAFDEEGRQPVRALDGLGREKSVIDPNGNRTTYAYYGAAQDGRLKEACDGEARCTSFEYDANGNVTRVLDHAGGDTLTQYDALNRPVRIAQQSYNDTVLGSAVRPVTCYAYDFLGNLAEIRAGHTTNAVGICATDMLSTQATYLHDDRGNRLQATDALARTTAFTYDVHDNLTGIGTPRGNRIERDYGYGGQLMAERAYAVGGASETTHTYTRNALGQVTKATGPAVDYLYAYDDAHRLSQVTDGRANRTLRYQWSAGGMLDRLQGPDGETTDYLYDPVGRLRHVWAPGNELVSFGYDAGGRLVEQLSPGNLKTRYTYFKDDALQRLSTTRSSTTLVDALYTQDTLGRRATLTESLSGLPNRTLTFGYDALSRVTSVAQSGGATQSFTYDPFGNRRSFNDGTTQRFYAYDTAHQLDTVRTGSVAGPLELDFSYDANGNTTGRDASGTANDWTYTYDARDRLTQASKPGTTESYQYDDQGRRIAKTTSGTRTDYLYDGLAIYLEVNGNWSSPTARLSHGPGLDTPLVRATASQRQVYTRDGMNSAVLVTDAANGTVLATQRFDAWGNKVGGSGTVALYGYAGREADASTGLTFMRARYYDPNIGRFTQSDPLGFIEGVNQYAYALNNPLNRIDPLGTVSQSSAGLISAYPGLLGAPVVGVLPSGAQSLAALTEALYTGGREALARLALAGSAALPGLGAAVAAATYSPALGGCRNGVCGDMIYPMSGSGGGGAGGMLSGSTPQDPCQSGLVDCRAEQGRAEGKVATGLDHVVLGKSIGLEARAASIGGRHLMGAADWQRAVTEAIANPRTRISVDVAGLEGTGSVSSRVMAAIQRGASGRGSPLDWELAQLRQSGRLSTVDFFEDANAIANPFR